MTHVEECPECQGRGYVARGYYLDGVGDPHGTPESCKLCGGRGAIDAAAVIPAAADERS